MILLIFNVGISGKLFRMKILKYAILMLDFFVRVIYYQLFPFEIKNTILSTFVWNILHLLLLGITKIDDSNIGLMKFVMNWRGEFYWNIKKQLKKVELIISQMLLLVLKIWKIFCSLTDFFLREIKFEKFKCWIFENVLKKLIFTNFPNGFKNFENL